MPSVICGSKPRAFAAPTPASIFGASLKWWVDRSLGFSPSQYDDLSGNGNHATQGTAGNQPGAGADFDGVDDYMTAADNAALDAAGVLVLGMSFTPDVVTGNKCLISKGPWAGAWSVQTDAAALRFFFGTPGSVWGSAAGALTAGALHRMIWAFDKTGATNADRLKLWINGAAKTLSFPGGAIPTTDLANNAHALALAAFGDPTQHFAGVIRAAFMAWAVPTAGDIADADTYLAAVA